MIVVHHLNESRSQRVLWLLEELALPYEIRSYQRDATTRLAPPELKRVHPLGKSPVLEDAGQTIIESGAIVDHLIRRHGAGALQPATDSAEYTVYQQWLHYAEGSAMPPLLLTLVLARIRDARMPFFARPVARSIIGKAMAGFVGPQVKLHLDWMESSLARSGGWFGGERFTAADIQMSFPVEAAAARHGLAAHPQLAGFLQRIHARPAYQRALTQGGRFALAGG